MSYWTDTINQRLQNHQNEITRHMRRHGVSHPGYRPWRYRDLYNGYNYFGSPFLNGLGSILTSVFGKNSGIFNHQQHAALPMATGTDDIDESPALPASLPGASYNGEYSNYNGQDMRRDDRNRSHWWRREAWERMPMVGPIIYAQPGYSTPWIMPTNNDPTQQDAPVFIPEDTIMGLPKRWFYLGLILIAVFLYFKYKK